MNFTCKYCGIQCNSFILEERAHVCHRCGTLRKSGIELDISLFWNRQQDEDYFNWLDIEFDS